MSTTFAARLKKLYKAAVAHKTANEAFEAAKAAVLPDVTQLLERVKSWRDMTTGILFVMVRKFSFKQLPPAFFHDAVEVVDVYELKKGVDIEKLRAIMGNELFAKFFSHTRKIKTDVSKASDLWLQLTDCQREQLLANSRNKIQEQVQVKIG